MKKFLIIQTAFIGDVILATPLIENLISCFPDSKIDFLLKKGNEALLEGHPDLNKVLIFDKKNKFKSFLNIINQARKEKYDAVFNLHRFASSGIITFLSGAKKKYGFDKNPFSFFYSLSFKHQIGDGTHEVERNLQVISEVCSSNFVRPKLFPSQADFEFVSKYKQNEFICFAPASVWFTKQMPIDKWIELLKIQNQQGRSLYLLGGPNDKQLCDEIILKSKVNSVLNLAGKLSFMQSAALMKDAKMNFVNDSGPLHFASAMNAPVVAFFCSTVPDFGFGPLSEQRQILQVEKLDCRPCGLHGHKSCPKQHFNCGNKLDLNKLLKF